MRKYYVAVVVVGGGVVVLCTRWLAVLVPHLLTTHDLRCVPFIFVTATSRNTFTKMRDSRTGKHRSSTRASSPSCRSPAKQCALLLLVVVVVVLLC